MCVFFRIVIRSGKMIYFCVLIVTIMCTDKLYLLLVKFHLNRHEFCHIFYHSFVFALLFTFYYNVVRVSTWQKCACVTVCKVACLITCMWSVCFVSDTLIKSLELCQFLVSQFVTLTEDFAAPGSKSSRIVVQRLEELFCIMMDSLVSVVCLCVNTGWDFFSITRKKKLNILW